MPAYSQREQATIKAAWADLIQFADCKNSLEGGAPLQDLVKREKRRIGGGRAHLTQAKALLLASLANAHEQEPSKLWHLAESHRNIVLFSLAYGAELREQGVYEVARDAENAHWTAWRRERDADNAYWEARKQEQHA